MASRSLHEIFGNSELQVASTYTFEKGEEISPEVIARLVSDLKSAVAHHPVTVRITPESAPHRVDSGEGYPQTNAARIVCGIMEANRLSDEEFAKLLEFKAVSSLHRWKSGQTRGMRSSTQERLIELMRSKKIKIPEAVLTLFLPHLLR